MGKMDKIQMMIDLNNQLQQSCSKQDYPKQFYPKNQHPPAAIPKECWTSDAIVSSVTNIPSAPPAESWPTQNLLFRPFWSIQDNIKEFWDPDKENGDPDPAYEEKAAMKKKKKRKKNGIICGIISLLIAILVMVVLIYTTYKKQNSKVDLYTVPLLTTTWAPKIPNPFSSEMDGGTTKPMTMKDDLNTLKIKYALLDNEKRNLQRDIASYLKEIQEYEMLYKECKRNTSTKANISTKDISTPTCIPVNTDGIAQKETSKNTFPIPSPKPAPTSQTTQSQPNENLYKHFKTMATESSAMNSDKLTTVAPGNKNGQKVGVPAVKHSTSTPLEIPPEEPETTKSSNPKNIQQDGGTTVKASEKSGSTWGSTTAIPFQFGDNYNNKEATPTKSAIPNNMKQNMETTTKRISTITNSVETTTSFSINPIDHTTKSAEATTIESSTHKSTNQYIDGTKSNLNNGNTWKPATDEIQTTKATEEIEIDKIHKTTKMLADLVMRKTTSPSSNYVEELSTTSTKSPGNRNGRQDSIHKNPLFTSTQKPMPTKENYTLKSSTPTYINEDGGTTSTKSRVAIENTWKATTPSILEFSTYSRSITEMTTSKSWVAKNEGNAEKGNNIKATTTTKSPAVPTTERPTGELREVTTRGRNKLESTTMSTSDNPKGDETRQTKENSNSDNKKDVKDKNINQGHSNTKPNDKNVSETNGGINGGINATIAPTSSTPLHWFTSTPSAVTTLQSSNDIEKIVNKDEDSPTSQTPNGNDLKDDTKMNNPQNEVKGIVAHKRPDNLPNSQTTSEDKSNRNSGKSIPDSHVENTNKSGKGKMSPNNQVDTTNEDLNNIRLSDETETRHESQHENNHSGNDNSSNDLKSTNGDLQLDNNSPIAANPTKVPEIQDLKNKNDDNEDQNSEHILSVDEAKKNHENKATNEDALNNSSKNNELLSSNNTQDIETQSNTTSNEQNNNNEENSKKLESSKNNDNKANMNDNIAPKIGNPNRANENVDKSHDASNKTKSEINDQSNSLNANEKKQNSGTGANEQKENNNEFTNNTNNNSQNNATIYNGVTSKPSNPVKNQDTEKQSGNPQNKKPKKETSKKKSDKHSSEESDSSEDDKNSNESKEHDKKKTNKKQTKELDNDEHHEDHKKKSDKKSSKESNTNKPNQDLEESNENNENDNNQRVEFSTQKPSNKKKDEETKTSLPIPKFPINEPSVSTPAIMKPSYTNNTYDNERDNNSANEPSMVCSKKGKVVKFPFSSLNNSCYLNYTQQCKPNNQDANFSYNNTCLLMLLDTDKNPVNETKATKRMPQGDKGYTLSISGDHDGSFAILITMGDSILLKVQIEEMGDSGDLARVQLSSKIKRNGKKYFREEIHPVRFKSRGLFTMIIINDDNGYTIYCNNQWKLPLTFKQRLKEDHLVRRIRFSGAVSTSALTIEVLKT